MWCGGEDKIRARQFLIYAQAACMLNTSSSFVVFRFISSFIAFMSTAVGSHIAPKRASPLSNCAPYKHWAMFLSLPTRLCASAVGRSLAIRGDRVNSFVGQWVREPGVWIECRLEMRLYSFTVRLRRGNIFALSDNDEGISPRHACMHALTEDLCHLLSRGRLFFEMRERVF